MDQRRFRYSPKSRPKWRTGAVVDSDLTAAVRLVDRRKKKAALLVKCRLSSGRAGDRNESESPTVGLNSLMASVVPA
jgi:hypothetical protein